MLNFSHHEFYNSNVDLLPIFGELGWQMPATDKTLINFRELRYNKDILIKDNKDILIKPNIANQYYQHETFASF